MFISEHKLFRRDFPGKVVLIDPDGVGTCADMLFAYLVSFSSSQFHVFFFNNMQSKIISVSCHIYFFINRRRKGVWGSVRNAHFCLRGYKSWADRMVLGLQYTLFNVLHLSS